MLAACRRAGVRFSVTTRMNPSIRAAVDAIPATVWTPIPYWLDGGAEVAEVGYTCFDGTRDRMDVRLIVRRVRPAPGSQLALDVVFDHHALVTDLPGPTARGGRRPTRARPGRAGHPRPQSRPAGAPAVRSVQRQRRLAALTALAHNLGRWTLAAAGPDWRPATVATLRRRLVAMPARLISSGRRLRLHAPTGWP